MSVDVATALSRLTAAGLSPFVTYGVNSSVAAGMVASQVPAAGVVVPVNSQVVLTVSTGAMAAAGSVVVPNVVGLWVMTAVGQLSGVGISIDKHLWVVSGVAQGYVVGQSLLAGSVVVPGSICQLQLSAGPARVPVTVSVPVCS